jgi:hypothetical protein
MCDSSWNSLVSKEISSKIETKNSKSLKVNPVLCFVPSKVCTHD